MILPSVGILRSAYPDAELDILTRETNRHAAGCTQAFSNILFWVQDRDLSCPAGYFKEASSLNFGCSMKHGFLVLGGIMEYVVTRPGMKKFAMLNREGIRLLNNAETEH